MPAKLEAANNAPIPAEPPENFGTQCIICGHVGANDTETCTQCGSEMVPISLMVCEPDGDETDDTHTMHDQSGVRMDNDDYDVNDTDGSAALGAANTARAMVNVPGAADNGAGVSIASEPDATDGGISGGNPDDTPASPDGASVTAKAKGSAAVAAAGVPSPATGSATGNGGNDATLPSDDKGKGAAVTAKAKGSASPSEAKLSYKQRKGLPASAFLYKSPDGKLHLPYRTASGAIDKVHLRAIVQWGVAKLSAPDDVKARLLSRAQSLARKNGIEVGGDEPKKETFTDSVYAVPIIEKTVNAQGYHHGKLLISKADYVNRNNRLYPLDLWQREAARSKNKIESGMLTGQAEHPDSRPQLLDQFLKFTELTLGDDGLVYAEFNVIPTSKGEDFTKIAQAGVRIGTSTRGAGSVKREKRGGREVSVIQPDYELQGIDVMLFGEQSVEDAGMTKFERIEIPQQTESDMPIETVQALREAYPDLVAQIETPLNEAAAPSLAALKAVRAALSIDESANVAEAVQAVQNKLAEAEGTLAKATEAGKAQARLLELARELKHGSWLVVEHLKGVQTVAEVEAQFPRVKVLAESELDRTITGMGVAIAQPEDGEPKPAPEAKTEAAQPEPIKGDPRLLAAAGALSFRRK